MKEIKCFFKSLNPYSVKIEVFKIEDSDNHNKLDNVMFYGMSAKKYCLDDLKENGIEIRKYSAHGLGHLLS